jgi:prepilin peptidase CpaA
MAAVGAVLGAPAVVYALIGTFIAGGVVALLFALYHRGLRRLTGNVVEIVQDMAIAAIAGARPTATASRASVGKLPYAVSIAVGTIGWLLVGGGAGLA